MPAIKAKMGFVKHFFLIEIAPNLLIENVLQAEQRK